MTNWTGSAQSTAPAAARTDDGYDEHAERLEATQADRNQAQRDDAMTADANANRMSPDESTQAEADQALGREKAPAGVDDGSRAQTTQPGEPTRAPSDRQLAPGTADDPVAALWGADLVERYREQWRELQLRFVDDPHTATEQAAGLVNDAVQSLTDALTSQKQTLDDWQSADRGDTEILRVALRRYRDFLDRLLGM
jgi:hypothetical protein